MEAKELRMGNLLLTDYDYLVEVEFIHKNHFDCRELTTGIFVVNGKYKPIPLTEDWLIKFGFKNRYLNHLVLKEEFYCYCYHKVKGLYIQVFVHDEEGKVVDAEYLTPTINYVHELQNLYFSLTKKELTIKK